MDIQTVKPFLCDRCNMRFLPHPIKKISLCEKCKNSEVIQAIINNI